MLSLLSSGSRRPGAQSTRVFIAGISSMASRSGIILSVVGVRIIFVETRAQRPRQTRLKTFVLIPSAIPCLPAISNATTSNIIFLRDIMLPYTMRADYRGMGLILR